jgi:hypothetical protein
VWMASGRPELERRKTRGREYRGKVDEKSEERGVMRK